MPTKKFALARGEAERLEVGWEPGFENLTLRLDDELVGVVVTKRELKAGRSFPLADGTALRVRLVKDFFDFSLELERDRCPLPDSPGDLRPRYKLAYRILYFLGGFNLGGGLFLTGVPVEQLERIRPGWVVFTGLLYLICGLLTHRRLAPALILGIVVCAGDGIRSAVAALLAGDALPVVGLGVRGLLVVGMIRGLRATRLLPPKKAVAPPELREISGR